MKVRWLFAPLLVTLAGCTGSCSGDGPSAGTTGAGTATTAASAAAPTASASAVEAPTIGGKDDDPEIAAAAQKALTACGSSFKPETGFDATCEAFKAFTELKPEPGSKDATFVNWLDSKDEKVRWLGARGLAAWGATYKTDKPLAERVVGAGEREKSEAVAGLLGFVVGGIDVGAIGIADRVKDLLSKPDAPELLRRGVAASFVPSNRECGPCIDATRELAEKGESSSLRSTAVSALAAVPPGQGKSVCKTWATLLDGADDIVAAIAASRITGGVTWSIFSANGWYATADYATTADKCADQLDATLAAAEKRAKTGKITDDNWISALRGLLRPTLKASGRQKEKAITVAKQIVDEKLNGPAVRGSALKLVVEHDPAGKTFAKKFEKDPDPLVAELAKSYAPK